MKVNFTDRYLKSLAPIDGKQFAVGDGTGLSICVSPRGTKTWFYIFKHADKTRRLKLGRYPSMSLAHARKALAEAQIKKDQGDDPAAKEILSEITVSDLADEFYHRYLLKERKRPDIPRQMLASAVVPALGTKRLVDIKPRDIIKMLDAVVDRGASKQANRVLSIAKQMFSFGVGRGLLEVNPASEITRAVVGGKEEARERALSFDEVRAVWFALDAEHRVSPQIRHALKILILTGVRSGEIRTAEWGHIDFDASLWTIPKTLTKTAVAHKVHLSPMAKKVLRDMAACAGSSQYVMPGMSANGTPITDKAICRAVNRLQDRVGIDQWTAHDLRRTFATRLSDLKVAPHIVEKCLNHKLPKIMQTYNRHEYLDDRAAALDAWSARVEGMLASGNIVELARHG